MVLFKKCHQAAWWSFKEVQRHSDKARMTIESLRNSRPGKMSRGLPARHGAASVLFSFSMRSRSGIVVHEHVAPHVGDHCFGPHPAWTHQLDARVLQPVELLNCIRIRLTNTLPAWMTTIYSCATKSFHKIIREWW